MTISLLALTATIYQSHLTKTHNFKSVEPRINAYRVLNDRYRLVIFNNGLGPAFVEEVTYFAKGKQIEHGSINDALKILGIDEMCYEYGAPRPGDSFKNQEEVDLVKFRNTDNCALSKVIFSLLGPRDINIKIKFKSIYDEMFIYNYSLNKQSPI